MFKILNIYKDCWRGEASLKQAFWIVYVLIGIITVILADFLVDIFIAGEFTPFYIHNQYTDEIIMICFPYWFYSSVCVWICGKNSSVIWSLLSKILVMVVLLVASFHLNGRM